MLKKISKIINIEDTQTKRWGTEHFGILFEATQFTCLSKMGGRVFKRPPENTFYLFYLIKNPRYFKFFLNFFIENIGVYELVGIYIKSSAENYFSDHFLAWNCSIINFYISPLPPNLSLPCGSQRV